MTAYQHCTSCHYSALALKSMGEMLHSCNPAILQAVLSRAVPCCAVLCCAVLCCAVPHTDIMRTFSGQSNQRNHMHLSSLLLVAIFLSDHNLIRTHLIRLVGWIKHVSSLSLSLNTFGGMYHPFNNRKRILLLICVDDPPP